MINFPHFTKTSFKICPARLSLPLQSFNATCYSIATYIQPIYKKKNKARFFRNSSGTSPQLADTETEKALILHLKLCWCSGICLGTARIISACMCRVMNRLISWISRNLIECLEHYLWFCMHAFSVAPRWKWLTVSVAQQATMTIKPPDMPLLKKALCAFLYDWQSTRLYLRIPKATKMFLKEHFHQSEGQHGGHILYFS